MQYTIKAVRQDGPTVFTDVEYKFNGDTILVSVPHYAPANKEAIETGIVNRLMSEWSAHLAEQVASQIIPELELETPVMVNL